MTKFLVGALHSTCLQARGGGSGWLCFVCQEKVATEVWCAWRQLLHGGRQEYRSHHPYCHPLCPWLHSGMTLSSILAQVKKKGRIMQCDTPFCVRLFVISPRS